MTVAQLYSQIQVPDGARFEIKNRDGSLAPVGVPAATGQVVHVYPKDGGEPTAFTILVMGDVIGSGRMQLTQLVRMARAYTGERPLAGIYKQAALHTGQEDIMLTDLVTEAKCIAE